MKRTQIFALAGACALAVSAVVGGAGLSASLDVADSEGTVTERPGVSTVDVVSDDIEDATLADPAGADTVADPVFEEPVIDESLEEPAVEEPVVDEVLPPPPVVLPVEKDPNAEHSGKGCGDRQHDHDHGDGEWSGDRWDGRDGARDRGGDQWGSRGDRGGHGGHDGGRGGHSGGRR